MAIVVVILLMAFFPGVVRFALAVILLGLVALFIWTAAYPYTLTVDWELVKLLLEGAFHIGIVTFMVVITIHEVKKDWKRK
jgi:hypothetical protein